MTKQEPIKDCPQCDGTGQIEVTAWQWTKVEPCPCIEVPAVWMKEVDNEKS